MLNLIIKDVLIQKKTLLIILALWTFIFALVGFGLETVSFGAYCTGIVGAVYILIFTAIPLDEKDNSQIMLNSLPLTRSDLVTARYLSVIIISVLVCFIITLTSLPLQFLPLQHKPDMIGAADIILAFISISLMVSIYFPLVYKFGSQNLRLLAVGLLMAAFFGPSWLNVSTDGQQNIYQVFEYGQSSFSPVLMEGLAVILAGCILFLSYLISWRIYINQDL